VTYVKGQWKACCDRCGFIRLSSELRKEWTGLRVCHECWEPRHPQDLVRGVPDDQTIPWARPEAEPVFIGGYILTEESEQILSEDGGDVLVLE
jgi:hypothetical protein